MSLSKTNKRMLNAIEAGYYVKDGEVFSPYRKEPLCTRINTKGYKSFTFEKNPVYVHRVVAYQKYGDKIFDPLIEVRHKDNDSLNNLDDNIILGTHQNNMLDKPKHIRMRDAINASTKIRKFSDIEMEEIRKFHNGSYKETMEHFNISSKATLRRILNTIYVTKK